MADALLLASQSLPALILPFFVGHVYDSFEFKYVTVSFLIIQMIGQLSFCFALYVNSFSLAVLAMILFGSGSSAVSVAQRALVVDHYKGSEGFGIGCIHSVSSLSKFIGKVSIIPAVLWFRSYQAALLAMCAYTVFSLSIACYMLCGRDAPAYHTYDAAELMPALQAVPELELVSVSEDVGSEMVGPASTSTSTSTSASPSKGRSRSNSTSIQSFGFW